MTAEIVERVRRSARYRDVDASMLERLAEEELSRSRSIDDAVKRVKRRLHQAVGAFQGGTRDARPERLWTGDFADPAFRAACAAALHGHASARERVPHLDRFYAGIWALTGTPSRVLDVGCGLAPLALPWMGIGDATYVAVDADRHALERVREFMEAVGQPHLVRAADVVTEPPRDEVDVALLLKLVPTLDRQDAEAASRVVRQLHARHAVVTFPARSLGGHARGMERTYRDRLERLVADSGRVSAVAEASVPNELVFVLSLDANG